MLWWGAMFELLGLNMLRASSVRPTPTNYPGYDAVVTVADGATILFSLKSYGTSTHERTFESESAETERVFIEAVQKLHVLGLTLRAMTRNYPSAADWKALRQSLPTILGQTNYGRGPLHPVEETWAVAIADPPQEVLPLSNTRLSSQVLFLAPYHQNESKNLFDKLDDAAANPPANTLALPPAIAPVPSWCGCLRRSHSQRVANGLKTMWPTIRTAPLIS